MSCEKGCWSSSEAVEFAEAQRQVRKANKRYNQKQIDGFLLRNKTCTDVDSDQQLKHCRLRLAQNLVTPLCLFIALTGKPKTWHDT